MPVPVCIHNNILVELSKTFQDEIIADGGTKFYKDTTFRPEWNVTISGIVASVPLKVTHGDGQIHSLDFDRPRIKQVVKPGDELIFSYLVVMNRMQTDNAGDIFTRDQPKNPYITIWRNPNGLKLFRVYHNNDRFEVGLFDTKSRTFIDHIWGGEREVESFMGKYMPTENVGFNYKNLLPYDGKYYWIVDYNNAIAVKRGDSFEMIGDLVLIEPIKEYRKQHEQGIIEVYSMEQDKDYRAIGKILSIGEPLKSDVKLSVKPNDIICSDSRYVQKYEIDGKDYWIVRQKHIYGKAEQNEYIGSSRFS